MVSETVFEALIQFARTARHGQQANAAVAGDGTALELLLAPRFQALVEMILAAQFALPPSVLPEYRRGGIGRPDLAFARPTQPARSFIELKQPGTSLTPSSLRGHDKAQHERFCKLPLWGFSNFHSIALYQRGTVTASASILPPAALNPTTSDVQAERLIRRHDPGAFVQILENLALASPLAPRDAREVAEFLAHAARLTQHIVLDQCRAGASAMLSEVRAEFRETIFAHAAAGGYDVTDENALFAGAFAQTLAFGLLLAREASAQDVSRDAYRLLSVGIYPLLRATLRALTQDEVLDDLGVAFDVLVDTVNAVDPALLRPRDGVDPILYFYEDFLAIFDREARRRHGVFFTPVPVVRYMIAATDRTLRSKLGTQGLMDPEVLILDPACGTGTFLIAAASHVAQQVRETMGDGAVAGEIAALAMRLHGFELLVGPYTVAHYRLLREVASHDVVPITRLPIYLADTLTPAAGEVRVVTHLGFMSAPILAERQQADEIKSRRRILAMVGNPPYRRLAEGEEAALVRGWGNGFWDDLKAPVRNAGWGSELNTFPDLYIAFWRWSLWKLFESEGAPGHGVVCLITNRTFLAGHPYAGLRQMLRRRFEWIDIVDLRGDSRGARPAGIETDENVFAIQAGVCILIGAVSHHTQRTPGAEARVRYSDVWRHAAFTARQKQALLEAAERDEEALNFVDIRRSGLEDFVPEAFGGLDWPSLTIVFGFSSSGVQTKRDEFVYGHTPDELLARWQHLSEADAGAAAQIFHETVGHSVANALATPLSQTEIDRIIYRPLDVRYLMRATRVIDRRRPQLQEKWGNANVALYALPSGTGSGPAVWVHGLLPDYHSFRGSYGGYAFPLFDRSAGLDAHNLNPVLLAHLSDAYGHVVEPRQLFDAIAALLSATSYTARFAWDLQEAFPHVPFPASSASFIQTAAIGANIRTLETFTRPPAPGFHSARLAGRASATTLSLPASNRVWNQIDDRTGEVLLQTDGSMRVTGVPSRVWDFSVSGYRVLYRWLDARVGQPLTAALQRAILDLAWRIEELLHWFDAADPELASAIVRPLTRAELGLGRPAPEAVD